jgi:hypothetical protein
MNDEFISREYLESLSFSDLSNLADKYGIDVPENLDRRFLIAEILEIVEEFNDEREDMQVSSEVSEEEILSWISTKMQENLPVYKNPKNAVTWQSTENKSKFQIPFMK